MFLQRMKNSVKFQVGQLEVLAYILTLKALKS